MSYLFKHMNLLKRWVILQLLEILLTGDSTQANTLFKQRLTDIQRAIENSIVS